MAGSVARRGASTGVHPPPPPRRGPGAIVDAIAEDEAAGPPSPGVASAGRRNGSAARAEAARGEADCGGAGQCTPREARSRFRTTGRAAVGSSEPGAAAASFIALSVAVASAAAGAGGGPRGLPTNGVLPAGLEAAVGPATLGGAESPVAGSGTAPLLPLGRGAHSGRRGGTAAATAAGVLSGSPALRLQQGGESGT